MREGKQVSPSLHRVSARALRLRRIFGDTFHLGHLGTSVASAIVALDTWIANRLAEPYEKRLQDLQASDFIKSVAGTLTEGVEESERDLIKKSFEETLFVALGNSMSISPHEAHRRLTRYVLENGRITLIEMFLTNQLWNVLWFGAGDVFGRTGRSPKSLETEIRQMRQTCRMLAALACKSQGTGNSLDLRSANEVVLTLKTTFCMGENIAKEKLD